MTSSVLHARGKSLGENRQHFKCGRNKGPIFKRLSLRRSCFWICAVSLSWHIRFRLFVKHHRTHNWHAYRCCGTVHLSTESNRRNTRGDCLCLSSYFFQAITTLYERFSPGLVTGYEENPDLAIKHLLLPKS